MKGKQRITKEQTNSQIQKLDLVVHRQENKQRERLTAKKNDE